jgi:hypothetical protein
MKALSLLLFLCASLGWTQSAPPASGEKPDTVVAIFDDGTKMTQGELETLISVMPDNFRSLALHDPQRFLHVYGTMLRAAAAFKSQKLEDKTPYKQGLDFALLSTMTDLYIRDSTAAITVSPEEIEKYYNEHKEPFKRIEVSGLKVAFGGSEAPAETGSSTLNASRVPKKVLTEEEAKAKAEKLVAEIRGGADFAKLVLLESDDEASKAKGGKLGAWSMTDNVPEALRSAVLSLKQGEVSDPIRQSNGYWITHADAVNYAPLADVKDAIFAQLQQDKGKEWIQKFDQSTHVELPNKDHVPPAAPSDPKK